MTPTRHCAIQELGVFAPRATARLLKILFVLVLAVRSPQLFAQAVYREIASFPVDLPIASALAMSRDGRLVAYGSARGEVMIRDLSTSAYSKRTFRGHVSAIAIAPDRQTIAVGLSASVGEPQLVLLDSKEARPIRSFPESVQPDSRWPPVSSLVYSENGQVLLGDGARSPGTLRSFDVKLVVIGESAAENRNDAVKALAATKDGRAFVGRLLGGVDVVDLGSMTLRQTFRLYDQWPVLGMAASRSEQFVATSSNAGSKRQRAGEPVRENTESLLIIDSRTGTVVDRRAIPRGGATGLVFGPEGLDLVVAGTHSGLYVTRRRTPKSPEEIATITSVPTVALAASDGASRLAAIHGDRLTIHELVR
jgi:hypothetical protein